MNEVYPFDPLRYLPRSYIRGADFLRFAIYQIVPDFSPRLTGLDVKFPRFTTSCGCFEAVGGSVPSFKTPAQLVLTLDRKISQLMAYKESGVEAATSKAEPEAEFSERETIDKDRALLKAVPTPSWIDGMVYLTKRLHQRSVRSSGKWIFTRFTASDFVSVASLMSSTMGLVQICVELDSVREGRSSRSSVSVDQQLVGNIYFALV